MPTSGAALYEVRRKRSGSRCVVRRRRARRSGVPAGKPAAIASSAPTASKQKNGA